MAEKVVVIGSNSFSGAHFVDFLLDQGSQVIGTSRSTEPNSVFLPYKNNKNLSAFEFVQADMNQDLPKLTGLINDMKPDYVVNFAAQSMVAESWQHPEHWFQTNVVGQVKLHDQLRKMPFLKKYVHISTPEVYGSCQGNVTEDAVFNPSTPYAVSRAAADLSLLSFYKNYSFPVVFTRAANVYGPGQQLYRIIPRTILFALLGKKLQLHGGGTSVRSFIHMKDVSDGTVKVMREGMPGQAYHLSTERQISIRSLVEMITDMLDIPFADIVEIVGERPGKDAAYLLDSQRAMHLGWKPKIELEAGLKETIAWVKDNLKVIRDLPMNYEHKV